MLFQLKHSALFSFFALFLAASIPGRASGPTCALSNGNTTLTCTGGPGTSVTNNGPNVAGSPYPSSIAVGGITGSVTGVQVILNGVAANGTVGSTLEGAGFLLEAGTSGHYLEILHSVGNGGDESATLSNATINLADTNASTAPNNTTGFFCGNAPTGGNTCTNSPSNPSSITFNWKPASYPDFAMSGGGGFYPGNLAFLSGNRPQASSEPANLGSATFASVFTGDTPNQIWNLYLEDDDSAGDAESITSWTLVLTLSVNQVSTTTTLTSSLNPSFTSAPNNVTTLIATVSATSTPTGTVTFTDTTTNTTLCSTVALSSGVATCSASFSTEGFHSIQAVYNPTGSFLTSNATLANQWVKNHSINPTGTTYCNTGAISAPGVGTTFPYPSVINVGTDTPSIANSLSTLTVTLKTVTTAQAGGFPGADMILVAPDNVHAFNFLADVGYVDSVNATSLTLSDSASGAFPQNLSGNVTGTVSFLPTYYINGGADFNPTSPPSPAPQLPGAYAYAAPGGGSSAKTFTSEFDGANANGDWKLFLYDDFNGGTVAVSGGWCLNFTPSTGLATTTSLTGNPNGATTGASVTVTATVTAGGNPVTSGTVTFTENGVQVAGGPSSAVSVNSSGQASFTTSSLSEGDHNILATYNGNGTYSLSFGSYVQRVDDATTGPTISGNTFTYCNTGTVTLPGPNNASDIGQASPNPSNIFVTSLPGTIQTVQVDLKSLHMQGTDDNTASLLVGPMATTADSFDFFSNTGTGAATISGNFSFLDTGANGLVPSGSEPSPGSYKPTSYGSANTFFASSSGMYTLPAGPYPRASTAGTATFNSTNGVFGGDNGNGTWSLYFNQNIHQASDGLTNGWCLDLTVTPPVLTITETHTGPGAGNAFVANQTGTYTIDVSNSGPGSTNGQTVTVSDALPTGLTQSNISASPDWNCGSSTTTQITCTSTTAVSSGNPFTPIVVTITPALTSGTSASNSATVSGSGITGATSTADVTTIIHEPVLSVSITDNGSPAGTFEQGATGKTATITVSNGSSASGAGNTSSAVTVTFTLSSATAIVPQSITPPGSGWTCQAVSASFTCSSTASPALATSGSAQFTLNFNVGAAAASPQTIQASISGGGGNTPSSTDTLTIVQGPVLTIAKSHMGNFTQGGSGVWNLQVSNGSTGSATAGVTTVSDTLPTGYMFTSATGTGWSCGGTTTVTCTSSQTVAATASFNALAVTVSVPAGSPTSVSNTALVFGGGDPVHTNLGSAASSSADTVTVVQVPASMGINAGASGQSATVSTAFTNVLAVTIKDAGGNPVSGVTVTFTAPATGASGTFSNSTNTITVATNSSGIASAPFTANATAGGPYNVSAASAGLTTVTFSLTNSAVISSGPSVVSFNVLFGTQSYNLIGASRMHLPWQITGVQVVFSAPITSANISSLSGVTATGFSGLGTNTLTWTFPGVTNSNGTLAAALVETGPNAIQSAGGALTGSNTSAGLKILEGDFNDDGVINASDLALVNGARSAPYNIYADINGDGVVNIADVNVVRTQAGQTNP